LDANGNRPDGKEKDCCDPCKKDLSESNELMAMWRTVGEEQKLPVPTTAAERLGKPRAIALGWSEVQWATVDAVARQRLGRKSEAEELKDEIKELKKQVRKPKKVLTLAEIAALSVTPHRFGGKGKTEIAVRGKGTRKASADAETKDYQNEVQNELLKANILTLAEVFNADGTLRWNGEIYLNETKVYCDHGIAMRASGQLSGYCADRRELGEVALPKSLLTVQPLSPYTVRVLRSEGVLSLRFDPITNSVQEQLA